MACESRLSRDVEAQDLFIRATLAQGAGPPPPRAILVFAHPDDETIALGARLARFRKSIILHVTDGAPRDTNSWPCAFSNRDAYRVHRENELRHALKMLGLEDAERISFEIPDQEASFELRWLITTLYELFVARSPAIVFTHPYEGGHPDHDACAFAVHRAAARMQAAGQEPPMIIEAAFYHLGPQGIETGCFLSSPEKTMEISCPLSLVERRCKQAMFACFPSQHETLKYFTLEHEYFRVAPRYDFHEPPHGGLVFYDRYSWGMRSQRFCELARAVDAKDEETMEICR